MSSTVRTSAAELPFAGDPHSTAQPLVDRMASMIHCIANSHANVLITGESGTGKELVARAIHAQSDRRNGPFRAINCAALPESLFESELFGHEAGAFTGALGPKPGLFELTNNGTLLLDEIAEMLPALQAKLLRVLQEREVQRLGSLIAMRIDVRVIATTNRILRDEIVAKHFREDLFYRLNVVPMHLPPLRERTRDISVLVEHFIAKGNSELCRSICGVSPSAMALLERYAWPGNVRELENYVTRAMIVAVGPILGPDDFPMTIIDNAIHAAGIAPTVGRSIHEVVRDLILATYEAEGHNQTHAATLLGISTRTLRTKLYEYGAIVHGEGSMLDTADRVRAHAVNDIRFT